MTIAIHGTRNSSYVRTARMTCLEKGLEHTLEEPQDGQHPWKRVPVMRHGDITLYETSAIIRYLDEVGTGASLLPATPAARATMEQWISAINCYMYDTLVRGYAFSYIGARIAGRDPDPQQIRASLPALDRDVARLDGAYARSAYLAGDAPSLVDLL
ncbi:MAG: glutathione S-transferase family protein, partial [Polyangiales bacterium]